MFVKHCKVEVYLTELKLCEDSNMDNVITRRFSKADTIGKFLWFGDFNSIQTDKSLLLSCTLSMQGNGFVFFNS